MSSNSVRSTCLTLLGLNHNELVCYIMLTLSWHPWINCTDYRTTKTCNIWTQWTWVLYWLV